MADLELAFRSGVREVAHAQAEGASNVVISVDRLGRGVDGLQGSLADVGTAIGSLCSSIDSGFSELSYQMRMQSGQLKAILEVLQAPLDTQSKELRNRAQEAYANGWIDDAESDFIQSVELNRYDFTLHQGLGNIAFFHRSDRERARECYARSAKYAAPKSPPDEAVAHISLAAVAEASGDLQGALSEANLALHASSDLGESHYVVAKYTSATGGDGEAVVRELLEAFRRRVALTLWADRDPLLAERRELVEDALVRFRDELRADVRSKLDGFTNWQRTVALVLTENVHHVSELREADEKAVELEGACAHLVGLDSILDLHEAQQILISGLPAFLRAAQSAAQVAASKLELATNTARRTAEGKAKKVKSLRGWYIAGGLAVGLALGLMSGAPWFLLAFVGGVVGLIGNLLLMGQAQAYYTDRSAEARALSELATRLAEGLNGLPEDARNQQPSLMFAASPTAPDRILV